MKVILSRKGMDSENGGVPSPILPDGTLLSLPIPDGTSGKPYGELFYKEQSYQEIIYQLRQNFDFDKNKTCHLDPDIYDGLGGRPADWKPAFGQCKESAEHLDHMSVDVGDIFLFYGMFKQTEQKPDGTLEFVGGAPIRHIIYGYMKVGEILRDEQEISRRYPWHPHGVNTKRPYNRLYIPSEYGTFGYDDKLVLTKKGQTGRSMWALPPFFAQDGISVSWQGKNKPELKDSYAELRTAAPGQEFVVTTTTAEQQKNLSDWADGLIRVGNASKVVHLLYPDEAGCIYCKKINGIIRLVEMRTPCLSCEQFTGTIQGEGCECVWKDGDFQNAISVYDHIAEYDRVNSFKPVFHLEKLKIWQEKNEAARLAYEKRKWGR